MPGHYKKIMLGHYKKTANQSVHTIVTIRACIINWNNNTLENFFCCGYVDLPRVMAALKRADGFLDIALTEKCKVQQVYEFECSQKWLIF